MNNKLILLKLIDYFVNLEEKHHFNLIKNVNSIKEIKIKIEDLIKELIIFN